MLTPGKIKNIYNGEIPIKQMQNICLFTQACKDYQLRDVELFQTCDLFEAENMIAVCVCIASLARKAKKNGEKGFGPNESEKNERQFTKEKIQEGKKIIGLQYGNNKVINNLTFILKCNLIKIFEQGCFSKRLEHGKHSSYVILEWDFLRIYKIYGNWKIVFDLFLDIQA